MKRRRAVKSARKFGVRFDSTEFLLLTTVTLVLLVYFGIQTGLLPNLFNGSAVLGAATGR